MDVDPTKPVMLKGAPEYEVRLVDAHFFEQGPLFEFFLVIIKDTDGREITRAYRPDGIVSYSGSPNSMNLVNK